MCTQLLAVRWSLAHRHQHIHMHKQSYTDTAHTSALNVPCQSTDLKKKTKKRRKKEYKIQALNSNKNTNSHHQLQQRRRLWISHWIQFHRFWYRFFRVCCMFSLMILICYFWQLGNCLISLIIDAKCFFNRFVNISLMFDAIRMMSWSSFQWNGTFRSFGNNS